MKFSHLMKPLSQNEEDKMKQDVDLTILEMATAPRAKKPKAGGLPEDDQENGPQATSKKIPEFKPRTGALRQTTRLFHSIFNNMKAKKQYDQYAGVLLSGDPGTGKTQRITLLSKILGVDLVTIEAPHIVEEHIINIPFIVFDSATDKKKAGVTALEGDMYKVVLADSNLYTALKQINVVSDEQHLKNIYKSTRDVIETYEALGGTPTELPEEIVTYRNRFKVILFLDEYFRQTSPRIKNMLRGILNGKIGNHEIPSDAYVVYATNLKDEGLSEIQQNYQFAHVELKNPSKDEWFSWLVNKYEGHAKVKLKPNLINRFHHILEDEHMSNHDASADVRTSPRRWEQLLLYINESLPAKDEKDAISLLTNVKTNFRNYKEGTHAELADKVLEATAELIKETSGFEVNPKAQNTASDWRSTLKHQIETKMKLGDLRKYVPIVSGLPGIGKTAQAKQLANQFDLRFIDIDCSTISPEDATGLPLPSKGGAKVQKDFIEKYGEEKGRKKYEEEHLETIFSMPGLYQLLMDKIKEEDAAYLEKLRKKSPDDFEAKKKEYEARPYKYLIFFDELNRNSPKVFNGIRRVLLEKNFGPSGKDHGKLLELPSSAIMLGAINPHDAGTEGMTKHVQDVLDIMDAKSSWKDTLSYMTHADNAVADEEPLTHDVSLAIIKKLVDIHETKDPKVDQDHRPFFWDLGQEVYISPREYFQMFSGLVIALGRSLRTVRKLDFSTMSQKEMRQVEKDVREDIFESLKEHTSFILFKQDTDEQIFYHDLKNWVMNSDDIDLGENFFYKKAVNTKEMSLNEIIGKHLEGSITGMHEKDSFIAYIQNTDVQKLREDLTDVMVAKMTEDNGKHIHEYTDEKWPAVRFARRGKLFSKKDFAEGKEPDGIMLDENVKVSSLVNFFRELFISARIHKLSGDKIVAVTKAFFRAVGPIQEKVKEIAGEEASENFFNAASKLNGQVRHLEHLEDPKSNELPDE